MSLRDALRRANETLDWIEQRQGPLPPDGYARIQTTVATVRAAGADMTDPIVLEREHVAALLAASIAWQGEVMASPLLVVEHAETLWRLGEGIRAAGAALQEMGDD